MAESKTTFRDFGVLPGNAQPPDGVVRCFVSPGKIAGQYFGTALVASVGIALVVLFAWVMPWPLNALAASAAAAGFAALIFLATHNDYRWVELDGPIIRAKHLYTRRIIERTITEIESLWTMVHQLRSLETVVVETLLGRIKGIEIQFEDRRTPLRSHARRPGHDQRPGLH